MNNNELKKFSRSELIDILLEQAGEIEELKAKLKEANSEIESKKLKLANVGNLAEASILVSGVLEAAQSAADIYLDNIRDSEGICKRMYEEVESEAKKVRDAAEYESKKMREEAELESRKMREEAEFESKKMRDDAEAQSKKLLEDAEKSALQTKYAAKAEADGYWNEVSSKLENFYNEHAGLRDLLRFAEKPKSE